MEKKFKFLAGYGAVITAIIALPILFILIQAWSGCPVGALFFSVIMSIMVGLGFYGFFTE